MSSPLTPKQWIIVIVVNVIVSAVTTLMIVRVLTNQANQTLARNTAAPSGIEQQAALATVPSATVQAAQPQAGAATRAPANAVSATATKQSGAGVSATAATTAPTRVNTPTATTPAKPSSTVHISAVLYPSQRQREVVVIVNEGDEVDMKGWTLSGSRNITYTFGNVTLFKDSFINLHTTTGADVPTDLFWNRTEPAWQLGDVITLAKQGQIIATFTVK
jgi:hypothetical protein